MDLTESIDELCRRTELTCKARYHAARRLNIHGIFSQWTLAFLAIGQIVITLVPSLGIKTTLPSQYINFMEIFFGILVLAYSLLLGMGNHVARSIQLHQCGLELGELARRLHRLSRSNITDPLIYDQQNRYYYSALEKCENHTRADYLVARLEHYQSEEPFRLFAGRWYIRQKYRLEMYCWHFLQFTHYIVSVGLIAAWIWLLVKS